MMIYHFKEIYKKNNMQNLNKLAKEIYEANKAKGFHEKEKSIETMLMLVITELSEAVEADRKARYTSPENKISGDFENEKEDILFFEKNIKDTVQDELADAYIRLLDTAGAKGLDLSGKVVCDLVKEEKQFIENVYKITGAIALIGSGISGVITPESMSFIGNSISESIFKCIKEIEKLAEIMKFDLGFHVSEKLKYNKTRPIRHGKEY